MIKDKEEEILEKEEMKEGIEMIIEEGKQELSKETQERIEIQD